MTFDLHHPSSVEEAVGLARKLGPGVKFLAGGTDLVIQINRGKLAPAHLIDITRLTELTGIDETEDEISLGALTTYRAIERHAAFQGRLLALAQAAGVVAGHQVRNIATIGGNIVNASPAADFVPPLLALDASLEIVGPDAARSISLHDFLLGAGKTALKSDELVSRVRFRKLTQDSAAIFLKEGRRKAMEISVVCVAACLTLDARGSNCVSARLAIGAVGPRTLRPLKAEACLIGAPASKSSFQEAGRLAAQEATPISDVRASAEYRRHLVAVQVERALARCFDQISGERQ